MQVFVGLLFNICLENADEGVLVELIIDMDPLLEFM